MLPLTVQHPGERFHGSTQIPTSPITYTTFVLLLKKAERRSYHSGATVHMQAEVPIQVTFSRWKGHKASWGKCSLGFCVFFTLRALVHSFIETPSAQSAAEWKRSMRCLWVCGGLRNTGWVRADREKVLLLFSTCKLNYAPFLCPLLSSFLREKTEAKEFFVAPEWQIWGHLVKTISSFK